MKAKKKSRVLTEPIPQRIHSQTAEVKVEPESGERSAENEKRNGEMPPVALVTLTYVPASDGIHVQLHFPNLLSNEQMLHILQRSQEFVLPKKIEAQAKAEEAKQ